MTSCSTSRIATPDLLMSRRRSISSSTARGARPERQFIDHQQGRVAPSARVRSRTSAVRRRTACRRPAGGVRRGSGTWRRYARDRPRWQPCPLRRYAPIRQIVANAHRREQSAAFRHMRDAGPHQVGGGSVRSCPGHRRGCSPAVGRKAAEMQRSRVVLPAPFEPMMQTSSPGRPPARCPTAPGRRRIRPADVIR